MKYIFGILFVTTLTVAIILFNVLTTGIVVYFEGDYPRFGKSIKIIL